MFLIALSIFFLWMAWRGIKKPTNRVKGYDGFDLGYIAAMICLAVAAGWVPFKAWRFEQFLSEKATILAERRADVHCNTAFDAIFDNDVRMAGHANIITGEIVFQYGWCAQFMEYLDHPENITQKQLFSLHILTHESMHARGEYDEHKTDCQAVQRNYRAAKLVGVPDHLAKEHAVRYYKTFYPHHPYYSNKCGPGKAYDEELSDSTWLFLNAF